MTTAEPRGGRGGAPGVLAEAIWSAANRRMADLRIMVSDDRVAANTLNEICTLLREWERVTSNGPQGGTREAAFRPSARAAHPSLKRGKFGTGVRPSLTSTAYSYALDFGGSEASPHERDYKARMASDASTLTDNVSVWRAIQRANNYANKAAAGRPSSRHLQGTLAFSSRVPSLQLDFKNADPANYFDYVHLESPAPPAGKDVIRINVRSQSARSPSAAAKMQRPESARMASRREAAASNQRPSSARSVLQQAPMTVRALDPGQESAFLQLKVSLPHKVLYENANFHDHLRWLNVATCAELVDAICRRPHEDLAPQVSRLQDHLQIFSIVSNTFNSRVELERQYDTIEKLHHQRRELMEALRNRESEVLRLRDILDRREISPRRQTIKPSDRHDGPAESNEEEQARGKTCGSEHAQQRQTIKDDGLAGSIHEEEQARGKTDGSEHDQQAPGNPKATTPERVAGGTSARGASVLPDKILEKQRKERESIVKEANDIYAQQHGVRKASYSTVADFYKGLDRFNGMPVAAGEVDFLRMMEHEFCGVEDADTEFETYNYGGLRTTLRQEWEYVVNPVMGKDYPGLKPKLDECKKEYASRDGGCAKDLTKFLEDEMAKRAGLRKAEVIALRLHTGPVYMHLNGTLRSKATSAAKNRFTVTISMVNSAIRKLVRVTPIKPDKCHNKLYRGISKMAMPEQFFKPDKNNCRGFVEPGFTSATTDRNVAIHYAGHEMPSILEIHTGQVDHGADLTWVSQFPGEKEMLILPLSNFEVFDMHREGNINIYECGLNLNLNSKSLEDLLETRKLSVLDFGQCLWNEARLVLYSNASFADLLPPSASEEAFLGNIMEKDQEYFHDIYRFYLSMTDLFYRWRKMMHESAKRLKGRAEAILAMFAEEAMETEEDRMHLTSKDIIYAKELLRTAERVLEASTSIAAGFGDDLSADNQRMLDDLQCELLPTVIELEAHDNKATLATALMKKTSRMLQRRRTEDKGELEEISDHFVHALAVRSEAFCTNKLNQKQAHKLLKTLLDVCQGEILSLDLASWVWTNDSFHKANTDKENKKEITANLDMLKQLHKFGLRSLEDAVSYLKKEDLSRMSLDAKRQEILCTELDQVRENILQKNSNPSAPSSPSRRISMDEWLKKKQEEERARKKKAAKDMKAAAPKKNVIRLSEDLAQFKESEAGQRFRESRSPKEIQRTP